MEQQSFTTVPRPYETSFPARTLDPRMTGAEAQAAVPRALTDQAAGSNLDRVWMMGLGDYPGAKSPSQRTCSDLSGKERARHRLQCRFLLNRNPSAAALPASSATTATIAISRRCVSRARGFWVRRYQFRQASTRRRCRREKFDFVISWAYSTISCPYPRAH